MRPTTASQAIGDFHLVQPLLPSEALTTMRVVLNIWRLTYSLALVYRVPPFIPSTACYDVDATH